MNVSYVEGAVLNDHLWGEGEALDTLEFALVSSLLEKVCSLPDAQVVDVGANSGWGPANYLAGSDPDFDGTW